MCSSLLDMKVRGNGSSEKRVSKEASDEISLYRLLRKRYGTHPQRMIPRNDFRGLFPTKISLYWRRRTRYGTSPNGAFPRNDFEGCFRLKFLLYRRPRTRSVGVSPQRATRETKISLYRRLHTRLEIKIEKPLK